MGGHRYPTETNTSSAVSGKKFATRPDRRQESPPLSDASNGCLVLHPADPEWAPDDTGALTRHLKQIGFIGNPQHPHLYSTGPAYLELVTYLGCSPQISLGETESATLIHLSGPYDRQQFLSTANARPRCQTCRQTIDPQTAARRADEIVICPHCKTSGYAAKLDWRRKAGCGRFFIEISNVFESEAVPGETLLEELGSATGQVWDYFYWRKD